jgi:hypothetical protein
MNATPECKPTATSVRERGPESLADLDELAQLDRIGIFDRQTCQPYALSWEYRLNIMMRLQMHWRVHRLLFAQ